MSDKVLWPFGAADVVSPVFAVNISVDVENTLTIVKMPVLTAATNIDLVIDSEIRVGAMLIVQADQGATGRNVAFGTNIIGDDLVGVANDKDTVTMVYDGSMFRITSKEKTVDAA